jgi:hypothetical protein
MRFLTFPLVVTPLLALLPACEGPPACTAISVSSIVGVLVDANQQPVPIDSVEAHQWGLTRQCEVQGNEYDCRDLSAGGVTLEVSAEGKTLKGEAKLKWKPGNEECHTETESLDLTMPGPGCPAPMGNAVTGTVLDRSENPAKLLDVGIIVTNLGATKVSATGSTYVDIDHSALTWCTIDGASFACPALTSYDTPYTVYARTQEDFFTQELSVTAPDCGVAPVQLDIRMSNLACSRPVNPAVEGYVWDKEGHSLKLDSVRARLGTGEFKACTIVAERNEYYCAAQGNLGGVYGVEVLAEGTMFTADVSVPDTGCALQTTLQPFFVK